MPWRNSLPFLALAIALLAPSALRSGDPPFPNELLYPNIVPPKYQFGTLGRKLGQFSDPGGVAVDRKGLIYIADTSNDRVQVLTTAGLPLKSWGDHGLGDGQFCKPEGIAVDDKFVYVSDTGNNRVQVFTTSGQFQRSWGRFGGAGGEFRAPEGIEVDKDRVYVADTGNDRIQVFDHEGNHLLTIGTFGNRSGEFNMPTDVAPDGSGNIYVADSRNNRVQKFAADGGYITSWGTWGSHAGLFATPISVEVRRSQVYVADLTNHRIQVFNTAGDFIYQWGRHPPTAHEGNGRVHYPTRIAVSPDGRFAVVCEPIENRFQVFERTALRKVKRVNDSAWWEKATKFHYGSGATRGGDLLAVWEPDTHSVIPFDISGNSPQFIAKVGGQGSKPGQLIEPGGATVDPTSLTIQVSDSGNARLETFKLQSQNPASSTNPAFIKDASVFATARVIRTNNQLLAPLEHAVADKALPNGVIRPGVIAYDRDKNFYLYDQGYARIIVFAPDGHVLRAFGRYGVNPGEFRRVFNISFSKNDDKIFVVDSYNFRIQVFDKAGNFLYAFGKPGPDNGEFIHPFGIASGIDGFVYVTDAANHNIQKFDENGAFVARWGRWGTGPGQFYKPKGIVQDERGRLYVIDFGNHRGQVLNQDGSFVTAFGMSDLYQEQTGNAVQSPNSVAAAPGRLPQGRDLAANVSTYGIRTTTVMLGLVKATQNGFAGPSNAGTYRVTVEPRQNIVLNLPLSLDVTVTQTASNGGSLQDLQLSFDALMPAHYHGMTTEARVRKVAPGRFVIENFRLHMPGHWELYFDIQNGDQLERAQADVVVQ